MAMIYQLIYYSRDVAAGRDQSMLSTLREIVSVSQRNNSRDGVTGFLIFDKTWFIQILEGEHGQVSETYKRIASDPRHAGATIINIRPAARRSFPNWTMGGAIRTPEVEGVYLRHGIGSAIEPAKLKSAQILGLAVDLGTFDHAKRQDQRLAS